MNRRPASLRGRVVVGVLALLMVLLAGLFTTVDLLLAHRLHADLRTRLTDRVGLARQLDGTLPSRSLVNRLRGDGVTARLCEPNGGDCVSSDPVPPPPPSSRPAPHPGDHLRPPEAMVRSDGPVLFVRTLLPTSGQVLTLSVDSSQVGATVRRLVVLEVVGGAVALLLAAVLLGRVVGTALRPLDRMTEVARQIAGGDRGRRIGGRTDTELGRTAAAFDAMLDELESAQERQRAFLSDASHELRSPLAGLQATSETLLRNEPGHAERERAYVVLVQETRRAARLVEDLLTVTRLDTGLPLHAGPVDLAGVARHEVERALLRAPGRTVEVTGVPAAAVRGDRVRLGQVVANLLDNAAHATGVGGTVTVDVGPDPTGWRLDVTDSGPGVPAADAERIFDRLVRLDPSRSRHGGGFGLGLPIARALARAHGGDLVCLPRPPGRGARFRLTVPRAAAPVGDDHAERPAIAGSSA